MSKVTVREASVLTGKSRETINTATNDGVLSFTHNARNVKVIDISELERVFPLVKSMDDLKASDTVKSDSQAGALPSSDLSAQVAVLKERLESVSRETELLKSERERERRQLEAEIENLRDTLEKAQDQHGKAMLLLTDQRQSEEGRDLEERKQLTETVELLKRQNKAIYRKLKAQEEKKSFWRKLWG